MSFTLTHLSGFGGSGLEPLAIEYRSTGNDQSDLTTYTFAGQDIGAEAGNRYVVVAVHGNHTGALRTITSLTVGGVSATEWVSSANGGRLVAIYYAALATGTTADVVVTFDSGNLACRIALYRVTGLQSTTAFDTGASTADPLDVSLDIPAGGGAIAVGYSNVNTSFTVTGLTEDLDSAPGASGTLCTASSTNMAAETARTVTLDQASSSVPTGAAVSFR